MIVSWLMHIVAFGRSGRSSLRHGAQLYYTNILNFHSAHWDFEHLRQYTQFFFLRIECRLMLINADWCWFCSAVCSIWTRWLKWWPPTPKEVKKWQELREVWEVKASHGFGPQPPPAAAGAGAVPIVPMRSSRSSISINTNLAGAVTKITVQFWRFAFFRISRQLRFGECSLMRKD